LEDDARISIEPDLADPKFEAKTQIRGFQGSQHGNPLLGEGHQCYAIALTHYYKHPSVNMILDPDIEIAIMLSLKLGEAHLSQNSFGYQKVYPEDSRSIFAPRRSSTHF
jgi:hypothetical protein